MNKISMLLLWFLFIPYVASAANIGESLPVQIQGATQGGVVQTLQNVQGPHGSVLFFVRSLDWCPFCQSQVLELRDQSDAFIDKGYQPIVISYDDVLVLEKFASKNEISFPLMTDENSTMIKALGILNDDFKAGSAYYGVPHPTVFIVDNQGVVLKKFTEENYKDRPDLDDILAALP